MCNTLETAGIVIGITGVVVGMIGVVIGVIGVAWGVWESHKRKTHGDMVFGFLRGVKTLAESNANTEDTSAGWKALIKQIDDINQILRK